MRAFNNTVRQRWEIPDWPPTRHADPARSRRGCGEDDTASSPRPRRNASQRAKEEQSRPPGAFFLSLRGGG